MDKPKFLKDRQGRTIRIDYPDLRIATCVYNAEGMLAKLSDTQSGTIEYRYDELGRLAQTTHSSGRTLSYAYDPVGNLRTVTYPGGRAVSYQYNQSNLPTEVLVGNLRTILEYDALGRPLCLLLPNGIRTEYSYNDAGRLARILTKGRDGCVLLEFCYEYDHVGNLLQVRDQQGTSEFRYDAVHLSSRRVVWKPAQGAEETEAGASA